MHVASVAVAEIWALCFLVFAAALEPRRTALGLLGFPCALQSTLYLGFFPFTLGIAVGFLVLAVWVRRPPRLIDYGAVAALLYVVARCHPIAAGLVGALLGAVVLARELPRDWPLRLGALLAASGPALVVIWLARDSAAAHAGGAGSDWPALVDRTVLVAHAFQPGGVWRPLCALAAALAGAVFTGVRARRGQARPVERALAAGALVLVALSMWLPRDFMLWQVANARLLPYGVMCLVALVPIERSPRLKAIALALALAYAVASFAWAARVHADVRDATRPALAGLDRVQPEPRDWLPIVMTLDGTHAGGFGIEAYSPLIHVADLYAMKLGGVTSYSQASIPTIHSVLRRHPDPGVAPDQDFALVPDAVSPEKRRGALLGVLAVASTHDGVVFVGRPDDVPLLLEVGFVPSFVDRGVVIGHFGGCPGRVRVVDPREPGGRELDVSLGWWPARRALTRFHAAPTDGVLEGDVAHLGCTEVWLDVAGRHCAGAPPGQPLRVRFTPGADNALACVLE